MYKKNVRITQLLDKIICVTKRVLGKLFDEGVKQIAGHLIKLLLNTLYYNFACLFTAGSYNWKDKKCLLVGSTNIKFFRIGRELNQIGFASEGNL